MSDWPRGVKAGLAGAAMLLLAVGAYVGTGFLSPPDPGPQPITRDLLALTPPSAGFTLAVPPASGMGHKALRVARRIEQAVRRSETPFAELLDEILPEGTWDQDDADQLAGEVGRRMREFGFEPDGPLAVYVDATDFTLPAIEAAGAIYTAWQREAALGFTLDVETVERHADGFSERWEGAREGVQAIGKPKAALAFTCSDPELVQRRIERLLESLGRPAVMTQQAGDITIQIAGEDALAYFFAGQRLIVGNSAEFVDEMAARVAAPLALEYGTAACRATAEDELVALARMDRVGRVLGELARAFDGGDATIGSALQELMGRVEGAFGAAPVIFTCSWDEHHVEWTARANLREHEALRETVGRARPVRLATALPESTLAFVTVRFNDASKATMLDIFNRLMPTELGGIDFPASSVADELTGDWLDLVDDELTLGYLEDEAGGLSAVGMLSLRRQAQLEGELFNLVPGIVTDTVENVRIKTASLDAAPIYYAIARNTLIAGNRLEDMKETIYRLVKRPKGGLFTRLNPPIDPRVNRYALAAAQSEVAPRILAWMAPSFSETLANVRLENAFEFRFTSDLEGTWLVSRVGLYFPTGEEKNQSHHGPHGKNGRVTVGE